MAETLDDLEDFPSATHRIVRTSSLMAYIRPVHKGTFGHTCTIVDYFALSRDLASGCLPKAPLPYRVFSMGRTAFCLAWDPSLRNLLISETAIRFGLPDLERAFAEYAVFVKTSGDIARNIGG